MSGQITSGASLSQLAEAINAEHRACTEAMHTGLAHAVQAGQLLIEAKAQHKHGGWLKWLDGNFGGTPRAAQQYMRVAREIPRLNKLDAKRVSLLSFRRALHDVTVQSRTLAEVEPGPRRKVLAMAEQKGTSAVISQSLRQVEKYGDMRREEQNRRQRKALGAEYVQDMKPAILVSGLQEALQIANRYYSTWSEKDRAKVVQAASALEKRLRELQDGGVIEEKT